MNRHETGQKPGTKTTGTKTPGIVPVAGTPPLKRGCPARDAQPRNCRKAAAFLGFLALSRLEFQPGQNPGQKGFMSRLGFLSRLHQEVVRETLA